MAVLNNPEIAQRRPQLAFRIGRVSAEDAQLGIKMRLHSLAPLIPKHRDCRIALALALSIPIAASAQAAELTIRPDRKGVDYGASVRIDGELKDVANPDGQPVELIASSYPYKREVVIETKEAAESGYYEFFPSPGSNTRYYVSAAGVESERVFIWVAPQFLFRGRLIPRTEKAAVRLDLYWGKQFRGRAPSTRRASGGTGRITGVARRGACLM